jgi:hypothetical protein
VPLSSVPALLGYSQQQFCATEESTSTSWLDTLTNFQPLKNWASTPYANQARTTTSRLMQFVLNNLSTNV